MLLRTLFAALLLNAMSLMAAEVTPQLIDYASYPTEFNKKTDCSEPWNNGYFAFNTAPEFTMFILKLKKDYGISTVVETGTFVGNSTVAFSYIFDQVHTIEKVQKYYDNAVNNLSPYTNVTIHQGSSEAVLRKILPSLSSTTTLFYLDAHWEKYFPLLDELEEISKTHKNNCIIVIDDFKVPGRPELGYCRRGNQTCSYEYVKGQLDKIFTSYDAYYLIPKDAKSRAKFVAIAKALK